MHRAQANILSRAIAHDSCRSDADDPENPDPGEDVVLNLPEVECNNADNNATRGGRNNADNSGGQYMTDAELEARIRTIFEEKIVSCSTRVNEAGNIQITWEVRRTVNRARS